MYSSYGGAAHNIGVRNSGDALFGALHGWLIFISGHRRNVSVRTVTRRVNIPLVLKIPSASPFSFLIIARRVLRGRLNNHDVENNDSVSVTGATCTPRNEQDGFSPRYRVRVRALDVVREWFKRHKARMKQALISPLEITFSLRERLQRKFDQPSGVNGRSIGDVSSITSFSALFSMWLFFQYSTLVPTMDWTSWNCVLLANSFFFEFRYNYDGRTFCDFALSRSSIMFEIVCGIKEI